MKRRIITLVIFLLLSSLTFVYPRLAPSFASIEPGTEPQRRVQTGRRARRPARAARARVDYSSFNHNRPEHRQRSCDSCHIVWAIEEKTQEKTSDALDIKDYPDHESCIDCHRQQFFKGARPAICSNCHNVVSPRNDTRFAFPKKNAPSQFDNIFPHASHVKSTMLSQFKRISGPAANLQSSCMYCHKPNPTVFKPAKGAPADAFAPPAGTFMTTPSSHVTCFQCHFQKGVENRETPPLATECDKCHANIAAAPVATPTPVPKPPTPAKAATATGTETPKVVIVPISAHASAQKPAAPVAKKPTPAPTPIAAHSVAAKAWPDRVVLKFAHEKDAHKKRTNDDGKEVAITCLQCHTAARKAMTLEDMRKKESNVQLSSCSSSGCHTPTSGTAQLGLSLYRELRDRAKEPKFECAFCHTPPFSTASKAPPSHYITMWGSAVKEQKSAKTLENIVDWIPEGRIVQKFRHSSSTHKSLLYDADKPVANSCARCHTAASETVQLSSCSSSGCHTAVSGSAQMTISLYRELRDNDKTPKPNELKFECIYCHSPPYSKAEPPCSHYAAVFASATSEKKSTKGIEQLTPQRCVEEQKK